MHRFIFIAIVFLLAACTSNPNEFLLKSSSQGDVAGIEEALKKGANINFINKKGYDALLIGVLRNKPASVRILLKRGAKIRGTDSLSAPEIAAMKGYNDILQVFFEAGLPPNWKSPSGRMLLHAAAEGPVKTVQLLLDKGVPVNAKLPDGTNALFHAVGLNNAKVVKVLLAAGADPNVKNQYGNCPLTMALAEHRDEIAKDLQAYGAKTCR